jgi:predicted acetyltransferase
MEIKIITINYEQKSVLRNLLELYKYDFSQYDQEDINESGLYGYKYLDHYWTEEGRHPFFINVNDKLAGFALIRQIDLDDTNRRTYSLAEFFIMKKYRKKCIGRKVAVELFNRFPGEWKVAQTETNLPAQKFWRKVIGEYTSDNFEEIRTDDWDGLIHRFETKKK